MGARNRVGIGLSYWTIKQPYAGGIDSLNRFSIEKPKHLLYVHLVGKDDSKSSTVPVFLTLSLMALLPPP
jgi:hypothetical protein